MRIFSPLLSIVLAPLLAAGPLLSQIPAPALGLATGPVVNSSPAPPSELRLELHIIPNDVAAKAGLTVEVIDQAGAPVPEAAVVFRLPDNSPLATFADGTLSAVSYTNSAGRAHIESLRWQHTAASVSVRITAVKGTAHAGLLIEESAHPLSAAAIPTPVLTPAVIAPVLTGPAVRAPGTLASSAVDLPVRHVLTTGAMNPNRRASPSPAPDPLPVLTEN